jgi:hypothetical protein
MRCLLLPLSRRSKHTGEPPEGQLDWCCSRLKSSREVTRRGGRPVMKVKLKRRERESRRCAVNEELGLFEVQVGVSSATPTGGAPGRRNIIPRAYCTWYVYPPQTSTAAQARQRERAGSACARELSPKHQTDSSRHTRPDATSTPRAAAAPVESWGTQIRMLMCWRCRPSQHHGVVAARPFSTRSALP